MLNQLSINNVYEFKKRWFFSLLIDMNDLFERFIVTLLKKFLPPDYKVEHGRKITNAIMANGRCYRYIIPDILVTPQKGAVQVLDAKYKNYSSERKVETDDIFQLHFYAQYCNGNQGQPIRSTIVCPGFSGDNTSSNLTIDILPQTIFQGQLSVRKVSIEEVLFLFQKESEDELRNQALNLIEL